MADDSDFDFERLLRYYVRTVVPLLMSLFLQLNLDRRQMRRDPEGKNHWMDSLHTRPPRHHHSLHPVADTPVRFPSDIQGVWVVPVFELSPPG
jgi:hypothetical protein